MGQKIIHLEHFFNGTNKKGKPYRNIDEQIEKILKKHPDYKYVKKITFPTKYHNVKEALLIVEVKKGKVKKGKVKKIHAELKRRRTANDRCVDINDTAPTDYMRGSNNMLDDMIEFVESL